MKWISYDLKQPLLLFLFYSFVAAGLLAPIATDNYIPGLADYVNHLAGIIEAKLAFAEGQFPLRIAPLEQDGLRYPLFQFYSPTTYTLAGAIYKWITPSNPVIAYTVTMWVSLVLAGIYMNRLVYWFVPSRKAALLASLVYLVSPYFILVTNNLGNLSETLALGLLPAAVFYTIQRYFHPNDNKTLIKTGLIWYLLITIHVVTFIYTSLFLGLFLIFMTCKKSTQWKNLLATGIAYALGLILALWYLAPAYSFEKYFGVSTTYSNPAIFTSFKPVISQLLFPGRTEYHGTLIDNHPGIGWFILISVGICVLESIWMDSRLCGNDKKKGNDSVVLPLLILFFIAFIFILSPINFWDWLPSLFLIGQYSWRFLSQVMWIGSLLFAFAIIWLFNNNLDKKHTIIGILLIIMAASPLLPTTVKHSNIDFPQFIKNPNLYYNQDAYSINFNESVQFIDAIDNIAIFLLIKKGVLQLNKPYVIPKSLLREAYQPFISLEGTVPDAIPRNLALIAEINGINIAQLDIKPGKYHWKIPITMNRFKDKETLSLQFKIPSNPTKEAFPIENINLSGFLNPRDVMSVSEINKSCRIKKTTKICKIKVPPAIKLIELPILYYPKLLEITLDGKLIPYQGIVYLDRLITGIKPIPGKDNTVRIRFRGLDWANKVSELGWCIWFFLLLTLLFRQIKT